MASQNQSSFGSISSSQAEAAFLALDEDVKQSSSDPDLTYSEQTSVTRLGDFSPFGRFFEAFGAIFFQKKSPKIWLHFGRFFEKGQNLDFYCY